MQKGHVTYYNELENYGFIESNELPGISVFFHKSNCVKSYKFRHKWDLVEYDLVEEMPKANLNPLHASNITFIENKTLESFRNDSKSRVLYQGIVINKDTKAFVKEIETGIVFPLEISAHEVNVKQNYLHGKHVVFNLKSYSNFNFIANIENREFNVEYQSLLTQEIKQGVISKISKLGYFVNISDEIVGLVPNIFAIRAGVKFNVGDYVNVRLNLRNKKKNKIHLRHIFDIVFVEKNIYQPGDSLIGTIIKVKDFGLIVSFNGASGLLNINNILEEQITSKKMRKALYKVLLETIKIGDVISVMIEKVENEKYSLCWDSKIDANRNLYTNLISKYTLMVNANNVEKKKKKIVLSGLAGVGKSTIGKILEEKLAFQFISIGNYSRDYAGKQGLTINEFQDLCKKNPEIDKMVDDKFTKTCNSTNKIIVDYRLGFKFIEHSFNVYLKVNDDVAAERMKLGGRKGEDISPLAINKRNIDMKERFIELYGVDFTDENNYDLVVDTSNLTPEQVSEIIINSLNDYGN